MAKASNIPGKMNIRIADEDTMLALKLILTYESGVRGRTLGQTCSELILETVDIDSYPEEIRARLTEIAEEAERRAVEKSLEMSEFED